MRRNFLLQCCAGVTVTCAALAGVIGTAKAGDLPAYMQPIAGHTDSSPAETATKNVLALNSSMFELYADSSKVFQSNILAQHPVILGLFTGAGGRFILYRPGQAPVDAPPVPIVYQLLKSVGHSTMALAVVVGPYLDNPDNQSWRGPMLAYRSRMKSALSDLDATPMPPEWRDNNRIILENNIAFMDECAAKGVIPFALLKAFSQKQGPYLKLNVAWAAQTQVAHWMNVISDWKNLLGSDWDKTYAASNTIYVTRQNNVLFSVLAQFFGPDAINDRLLLIETMSFTTTPADLLELVDPHRRRPRRRCDVLRQRSSDGLRTDGGRRPSGDHRRRCQARNDAVPAPARPVWLQAVAGLDHSRARTGIHCRPSLTRRRDGPPDRFCLHERITTDRLPEEAYKYRPMRRDNKDGNFAPRICQAGNVKRYRAEPLARGIC